jgi:vacuolar-type H+-ATPase subunit E/Vma4
MNEIQAQKILDSMIAFIRQHGEEEVASIKQSSDAEFIVQKNNYITEEKQKITDNFKTELENQEVRLKIEKSKEQNAARIERMRKVNEIVETLRSELKTKVRKEMKKNAASYKELVKNLLIQVSLILYNSNMLYLGTHQIDGGTNLH